MVSIRTRARPLVFGLLFRLFKGTMAGHSGERMVRSFGPSFDRRPRLPDPGWPPTIVPDHRQGEMTFSSCFRAFVQKTAAGHRLPALAGVASLVVVACGGSTQLATGPSQPGEVTHRDIRVSHEA